ncbi:MAG: 5-formyltetrahydrofolate cyclo-ligase [Candidatus Helarchaeota archaeon]|nr:5-formyltetrahydrofolate cyclo-ligase [Candidatus Helarchaeota archaeon]
MTNQKIARFPFPIYGRIPNFIGSDRAAEKIRLLPDYLNSLCIFTGPDFALKALRDLVLNDGKILAYATPHMKEFKMLKGRYNTTIKSLSKFGEKLTKKVDFVIVGSVAVDLNGNRIGKGSGYGDQEIKFLQKRFKGKNFLAGTLVHSSQIFEDFSNLIEPHDEKIKFILTEKELIEIE